MASPVELVAVRLVGVPVRTFLAAHQHYDDVLREIALVALDSQRAPSSGTLPAELVGRIEHIRSVRTERVDRFHAAVVAAADRGEETVDLELETPTAGIDLVAELHQLQERLDAHCRRGHLMTLEAPPAVKAFRRHLAEEFVRQGREGRPPRPFPTPSAGRGGGPR